MPTKIKPRNTTSTTIDHVETFRQHLALKSTAKTLTTRSDTLKGLLKKWLPTAPNSYKNENGSVFVDLDETIEVDGKTFKGMELRRSVTTKFNEETAEKVLKRKAKKDPAIVADAQSSYIDQDKIYRLVQEGRLTEKEVDEMFEEGESFAFWPVEGEVL